MFGSLGVAELVIILIIVMLMFGAKRLPELAGAMGKSIRSFKAGVAEPDEPKKLDEAGDGEDDKK